MPQVKGSVALCSSPRSLVCDEQGVGSFPLWKRYDQLLQIITKYVPARYQSFLARPVEVKEPDDTHLVWYAEAATGVSPERLTQLSAAEQAKYQQIKTETIAAYNSAVAQCEAIGKTADAEHLRKAMKYVGDFDDYFYCFDDRVVVVVWGMRPRSVSDPQSCVIDKLLRPNQSFIVRFCLGEQGTSSSGLELHKRATDQPIGAHQVPQVVAKDGYKFIGWDADPVGHKVMQDTTFTARYEKLPEAPVPPIPEPGPTPPPPPNFYTVRFEGEQGNELSSVNIKEGELIPASAIPMVPAKEHCKFAGWGSDLQTPVHENRTYRLRYDKIPLSWWDRLKLWWHDKGCLKWFLRILLFLLLLLLLLFLLRQCNGGGCSPKGPVPPVSYYDGNNPFVPGNGTTPFNPGTDPHPNPGDGLAYPPISSDDPGFEFLPEVPNKPVPIDDGDLVDDEEGHRKIVADRLNVLLDDDNLTINQFAADFKAVYLGNQYQIIYADPLIKRLQLQVPADERVQIKQELISKLPGQYTTENTFVWDEALMTGSFVPDDSRIGECWYHNTIKTYSAWDITMGSEDIVVAVVDDGFALAHEEFKGKVVKPYNVYTRTDDVHESKDKHGTHVAGLAVAAANNRCGIAGVAPNCKLMPVKVFDDKGYTSTMSVLDGVLYAVYNGADVVNLSLGMQMNAQIPVAMQQELIRNCFKEEERVWNKVFAIANRNNTAIVIAAGNEGLLAGIEPMHRSQDVIVVAAVGDDHNPLYGKTDFSNYGAYTDVSAPGLNILSAVGKNKYESMSGTSMAAPIVSGAVALVKSVNRPLSTSQIRTILQETGLEVKSNIGKLIQLDKALDQAQNTDASLIDTHPEPSTGAVQILLEWHNYNDLDLICRDPAGDVVWFRQKTIPSGGMLEIDMNAGSQYSSSPIENIYWREGGAPKGRYRVGILYYKRHDTQDSTSDFKVTVRYGDKEQIFNGTAQTEGEQIIIGDFVFE